MQTSRRHLLLQDTYLFEPSKPSSPTLSTSCTTQPAVQPCAQAPLGPQGAAPSAAAAAAAAGRGSQGQQLASGPAADTPFRRAAHAAPSAEQLLMQLAGPAEGGAAAASPFLLRSPARQPRGSMSGGPQHVINAPTRASLTHSSHADGVTNPGPSIDAPMLFNAPRQRPVPNLVVPQHDAGPLAAFPSASNAGLEFRRVTRPAGRRRGSMLDMHQIISVIDKVCARVVCV